MPSGKDYSNTQEEEVKGQDYANTEEDAPDTKDQDYANSEPEDKKYASEEDDDYTEEFLNSDQDYSVSESKDSKDATSEKGKDVGIPSEGSGITL